MGQVAAQSLSLIGGFLIVRWLRVGDYGQYGLVYSFQSMLNILVDLGFSTTIVALVGTRWNQPSVIGNFIRAGRSLRVSLLLVVFPVAALVFLGFTRNLKWGLFTQFSFLASILLALHFSGVVAYYGAPLLLVRRLRTYYGLQVAAAVIRILGCLVLFRADRLNASSAIWINVLSIIFLASGYRLASKRLIVEPEKPDPEAKQQIFKTIVPHLPFLIFFAFQGQISVFLVAAFGHGTAIAQVSALGRLGQMFVFLSASNAVLIEPWLARSPRERLVARFCVTVSLATLLVVSVLVVSLFAPQAFLALLGTNYSNLRTELRWQLLASGVSYLNGVVWTASTSRRFIYWVTSWSNISAITATQVLFIAFIGVSNTVQAIQLALVAASASLVVYIVNFFYGLIKGPRLQIQVETQAAA
jgi:O-antigen/teichoic acid export membrane protein